MAVAISAIILYSHNSTKRDRMADGEDSATTNLGDRTYLALMLDRSGSWVSYVNPTYIYVAIALSLTLKSNYLPDKIYSAINRSRPI
ncbi:MAG: hypothetical protein RIG63_11030 [Coleofasciculus chthonoplastes F3-SA18-01]|uniref:hypothetical protein n=1 Tax=Coleofasciculus chthonoplastes TaxID=64178 RepID=UPI0032FC6CCD